ncbi:hypothetical protein [Prevotella koreensis]
MTEEHKEKETGKVSQEQQWVVQNFLEDCFEHLESIREMLDYELDCSTDEFAAHPEIADKNLPKDTADGNESRTLCVLEGWRLRHHYSQVNVLEGYSIKEKNHNTLLCECCARLNLSCSNGHSMIRYQQYL